MIIEKNATSHYSSVIASFSWPPKQESNLYLALRRGLFYPLDYWGMPIRLYNKKTRHMSCFSIVQNNEKLLATYNITQNCENCVKVFHTMKIFSLIHSHATTSRHSRFSFFNSTYSSFSSD